MVPFAGESAAVLLLRAGRPHDRADLPLPARPDHERAQEEFAIDRIGIGAPMPTVHRDGGRVHDVALDPAGGQHTVDPEPAEPCLLDRHDRNRLTMAFGRQGRRRVSTWISVSAAHAVARYLLHGEHAHHRQPTCLAQFEGYEGRASPIPGRGFGLRWTVER